MVRDTQLYLKAYNSDNLFHFISLNASLKLNL